jgi:endonuclease IV
VLAKDNRGSLEQVMTRLKDEYRAAGNAGRFRKIPKVLETPKGTDLREDVMNLKTLRRLAKTL